MNIGSAVKQLRNELAVNQSELALLLNVSNITVNRWEKEKSVPNRSTAVMLLAIAKDKGASTVCQAALQEALFPTTRERGLDDLKYAEIDQINQLLNDSSNAVVVSDVKTHEILYMNKQAAQFTEQTMEAAEGKKCYEYLLHRDAPCKDCKASHISTEEYTVTHYGSQRTGRHYLMRGKQITWKGRPANIEYITDATELYQMKQELEEREQILLEACSFANLWFFKYNIKDNNIYLSQKLQEEFGYPAKIENYHLILAENSDICPESRDGFLELFISARNGVAQAETEVRMRFPDGVKRRLRLRMNLIRYDEEGEPELAMCSAQLTDQQDRE